MTVDRRPRRANSRRRQLSPIFHAVSASARALARAEFHLPSIRTSFIRPDDPLLIDTAAFTQSKWLATRTMSSLFALPSIAGARTWATQLPSDSCTNEELRAFGLTFTRITVPPIDFCDIGASHSECRSGNDPSGPLSATSGSAASSTALAGGGFLARDPGTTEALLDVATNHPAYDLRGGEVLLSAQFLEDRLLARINQDRQTCGALFELYHCVFHLHVSNIVE